LLFSTGVSGVDKQQIAETEDIINKWLLERQKLIVAFFKLLCLHPMQQPTKSSPIANTADSNQNSKIDQFQMHKLNGAALKSFNRESFTHIQENFETFRALLVDYISAGHFGVFEKIYDAQKIYGPKTINYRNELVKNILGSTNLVLEFEEKYAGILKHDHRSGDLTLDKKALASDVAHLMQNLETRFAHEDKLIKLYQKALVLNQKLTDFIEKKKAAKLAASPKPGTSGPKSQA
jgi:regulator of sigma D